MLSHIIVPLPFYESTVVMSPVTSGAMNFKQVGTKSHQKVTLIVLYVFTAYKLLLPFLVCIDRIMHYTI